MKQAMTDLPPRRWYARLPVVGGLLLEALHPEDIPYRRYGEREDRPRRLRAQILSLLRRLIGPLFGLLRTNFIFLPAGSEDVIGEFKRKFTILDRYVLDMSADPQRLMDRRIALALGLMLDTGERR